MSVWFLLYITWNGEFEVNGQDITDDVLYNETMENLDLSYLGTILDLSDIPQMYKQLKKTPALTCNPKPGASVEH